VIAGARRALVVAHPDDEAMWFAGALIRHPGDWTIICCSIPRTDPARAWKFHQACAVLGATGKVLPFTETEPGRDLDYLGLLDLAGFEDVLSHNWTGEYGHQHHRSVHQHLAERWPGRLLLSGYGLGAHPADHVIDLDTGEMERKLAAIRCYDHVSPSDGLPKSEALLARYGAEFNLQREPYVRYRG
jgi:LmbE family N-acetylglucosaminyl deacetylase